MCGAGACHTAYATWGAVGSEVLLAGLIQPLGLAQKVPGAAGLNCLLVAPNSYKPVTKAK